MVQFAPHMSGTLEGVSLADVLQVFHYGKKSVTVHVGGRTSGRVHMVSGEIHHAECGDAEGELALGRLINQTQVRIRTTPLETPPPHTVTRSFGAVVLDIFRAHDENVRDTADLPLPANADPSDPRSDALRRQLAGWLEGHTSIEHAAIIEPVHHKILACDDEALWTTLVQTALLQSLCAPYFDDAFAEVDAALGPVPTRDEDSRVTLVTFASRHYVLAPVASRGWIVVLIVRAADASAGLALAHMSGLEKAIGTWASV